MCAVYRRGFRRRQWYCLTRYGRKPPGRVPPIRGPGGAAFLEHGAAILNALTFRYIPGALEPAEQAALAVEIAAVIATAPLFKPTMPRTGKPFSVAMTNCGVLGWVSDRDNGYRYQRTHPETGHIWPPMPPLLIALWRRLSGYPHDAEACLINHYADGAKMGSHQDRDEADFAAPVLSISLGDEAVFHVGGPKRTDPKTRLTLRSGDVLLLQGESRLAFHGIDRIKAGTSRVWPAGGRINLTMRRVTAPNDLI